MNADDARRLLIAQHDGIRTRLNECGVLAGRLLRGEADRVELDAALVQLRALYAEHNATESTLVRSLLAGTPEWGAVLVDRMLEEHVAEHAAFWDTLSGPSEVVAPRIDDLIDELDAHMAAEERTFLSPLVLAAAAIERRQKTP